MLELRDISKSFGKKQALDGVSFEVDEGEVVALLGPSGSGKSTLLNVVAGIEVPDRGQVLWKGKDLAGVPAHRRGIGLMFQDFALFPHRDVSGNVNFGLQMAGEEGERTKRRVRKLLALVGLKGYEKREISSLSGGEQQRVALARALAPQPRLLMLDEPLGSLDRTLRERLLEDLKGILKKSGQTSLYVTHDQEEAYAIADRIVLLKDGRVAQSGSPEELYRHPATTFVARFLGLNNLLEVEWEQRDGQIMARSGLGDFTLPGGKLPKKARLLLRPDKIKLGKGGKVSLNGKVLACQFKGSSAVLDVEVKGIEVSFEVPSSGAMPKVGEAIDLSFHPKEALQVIEDG